MRKMERLVLVLIVVLAIGSDGLWSGSVLAEGGGGKPFEKERVIVKYRSPTGLARVGGAAIVAALSQSFGSENVQYIRPMSGGAHVLDVKKTMGTKSLWNL